MMPARQHPDPGWSRIILGSASPRRRQLLAELDLDFTVDARTAFEEKIPEGMPCEEIPRYLAEGKSRGFHRPLEAGELLITADTLVFLDGQALGKPHSREEAVAMLQRLSGRAHQVITGVCLRSGERMESFIDTSTVHFAPLSPEDISYYVEHYQPLDKAGAYGIQEWIGAAAITRIEGSWYNVMGLPTAALYARLQRF